MSGPPRFDPTPVGARGRWRTWLASWPSGRRNSPGRTCPLGHPRDRAPTACARSACRYPKGRTTGVSWSSSALLLLAVGGGVLTSTLTGVQGKELSLGWHADAWSRRPFGVLDVHPGGVGTLGLGVVPVAVLAVLLAWRSQLVLALAAGSAVLFLAALVLQYEPAGEVTRLDGHARNFALLALLVGLSIRLHKLSSNWAPCCPRGIRGIRRMAHGCPASPRPGNGRQARSAPGQCPTRRA